MTDFLQTMADSSRQRVVAAAREKPLSALADECADLDAPVSLDVTAPGMRVIAEIKVRSPAEGRLETNDSMQVLIERAQQLGHAALGLADVNTLAGVVRAWALAWSTTSVNRAFVASSSM